MVGGNWYVSRSAETTAIADMLVPSGRVVINRHEANNSHTISEERPERERERERGDPFCLSVPRRQGRDGQGSETKISVFIPTKRSTDQ